MIDLARWQSGSLLHLRSLLGCLVFHFATNSVYAATKTWDGKFDTEKIEVTVVYFVPADRKPLPDWRDRAEYLCRRAELFHAREFHGQSTLKIILHPEPLVSELTTAQLRSGDANAIFFRTMREADGRLGVSRQKGEAFPILLVLSEINWRPLDDFYRLKPQDGNLVFEGNYNGSEHFPARQPAVRGPAISPIDVLDGRWSVPMAGACHIGAPTASSITRAWDTRSVCRIPNRKTDR